ncbi:flavodoxin family protein [Cloacibacterium sp.]|uniref:flavodoxin family protein n=1 Tax=Cloacibacterium sp. TaxID=1913682 RepID=UPI0039E26C15
MLFFFCSCAKAEDAVVVPIDSINGKKVLIVYLTRTGNTEAVAKMIQQQVGGNLVSLELQTPYPENYQATVQKVSNENTSGYLPPLKTVINNIQQYDIVFIGFPTWGMRLPPPMKTFLTQYNLKGKTVVPFNTNAGYGLGSCIDTINQLCPNSKVLEAFSVQGGIERDGVIFVIQGEKEVQVRLSVNQWLSSLKF